MNNTEDPRFDASRVIRAPRGTTLNCKSWLTEARATIADLLEQLTPRRRPDRSQFTCILAGRLSTDEYRCSGNRERGVKPVEGG